jgi:hypothetical protein
MHLFYLLRLCGLFAAEILARVTWCTSGYIFGAFATKSCKKCTYLHRHICLSVRAPREPLYRLPLIWYQGILLKSVDKFPFRNNNNRHLTRTSKLTRISANISNVTRYIFIGVTNVSNKHCRGKWNWTFTANQYTRTFSCYSYGFLCDKTKDNKHIKNVILCIHFFIYWYFVGQECVYKLKQMKLIGSHKYTRLKFV